MGTSSVWNTNTNLKPRGTSVTVPSLDGDNSPDNRLTNKRGVEMTGCRLFEVNDGVWSQVENQVSHRIKETAIHQLENHIAVRVGDQVRDRLRRLK